MRDTRFDWFRKPLSGGEVFRLFMVRLKLLRGTPMRKKLKTNGHNITHYQVSIVPYTVESGATYNKLSLEVVSDSIQYTYDIHQDTRHPDLLVIKSHLESSLAKAVDEKLNVEVSEYKERDYLFVEFQSIGQQQYTGRRK